MYYKKTASLRPNTQANEEIKEILNSTYNFWLSALLYGVKNKIDKIPVLQYNRSLFDGLYEVYKHHNRSIQNWPSLKKTKPSIQAALRRQAEIFLFDRGFPASRNANVTLNR